MGRAKRRSGAAATAWSRERSISASTSIRSAGQPAYFSRSAISGARVPAQVTRRTEAREQLEVGVPDPGDVAAVGDSVVEPDPEVEPLAGGLEPQGAQDLVGARRVLDQQDRDRPAADLDRLHPPEGRADVGEGVRRPLRVDAELEGGGERGEGVVDVVEAGKRQLEAELARAGSARRPSSRSCRAGRSRSRRRRGRAATRRSWGRSSGRGGRRRRARRRRDGRSGGSAWRRRRAGARAAPARGSSMPK